MGGRRAHYTTRIAKRLCGYIALGDTLKKALAKEPLGPTVEQFWRWLDEYPEFQAMYERALLLQANLHADTIMDMAEQVLKNPRFAPAYRVAADILKWQAEIRNPAKFGPKVQIEHRAAMDPEKLRREIKTLEKELGVLGNEGVPSDVVEVQMIEVRREE